MFPNSSFTKRTRVRQEVGWYSNNHTRFVYSLWPAAHSRHTTLLYNENGFKEWPSLQLTGGLGYEYRLKKTHHFFVKTKATIHYHGSEPGFTLQWKVCGVNKTYLRSQFICNTAVVAVQEKKKKKKKSQFSNHHNIIIWLQSMTLRSRKEASCPGA